MGTEAMNRYIELLNGGLGLALFILVLVVIKDFNKEFYARTRRFQVFAALLLLSVMTFSIKELYKYGPLDFIIFDPIIAELLETLQLILIISAVFILMGMRKQCS